MDRPRRFQYPRIILGAIAAALALTATFNSFVDPLRVIGAPWRLDSVDEARDISRQTRAGKAGLIESHPDTEIALIGSSRMAIGMRHDDPAWQGAKTINFGMPRGLLFENLAMLDYLLANETGLERVVFNLDFGDLTSPTDSRPNADFYQSPLQGGFALEEELRYLFGPSSTKASIDTLKAHRSGEEMEFNSGGDWVGWHVPRPRELFTESMASYHTPIDGKHKQRPEAIRKEKLSGLKSSIAKCLERGIRVTLITMPMHALTYTWLGEGEIPGPPWETERRAIAAMVADLGDVYPDAELEWWDFAVFHPLTTESFAPAEDPEQDTRDRPVFWMDQAHPSPRLSSIMAARIAGTPVPGHPGPPFGRRIDETNLEEFLAELVAGDAAYRAGRPDEIAWAKSALEPKQP